jgi:hypothetical protein
MSLRVNASASTGGTSVLYIATKSSMIGSGTDTNPMIVAQGSRTLHLGFNTTSVLSLDSSSNATFAGVLDVNGTGENTFAGRVEITNSADATALRVDQSDNDGYGINVDCSHGTYVGRGIGMTFARARSADYYILEAHDSGGTMFSVKGDGTLHTATAGSSIAQESWNEVTPSSPFSNYGGTWDTCGYMKDSNGVVHLKGLVHGDATSGSRVIFTLPSGYRPSASRMFATMHAGSPDVALRVDIYSNGTVQIDTAHSSWVSLSEISFKL